MTNRAIAVYAFALPLGIGLLFAAAQYLASYGNLITRAITGVAR